MRTTYFLLGDPRLNQYRLTLYGDLILLPFIKHIVSSPFLLFDQLGDVEMAQVR